MNAALPQTEQPIEAAQRIGSEDRARWRRAFERRRAAELLLHCIGNDRAATARHPPGNRTCMVAPGRDDQRAMTPELADITEFAQIAAGIVDPEEAPLDARYETDQPMAAIGDVEIAALGRSRRERRPIDAAVRQRRRAAIAHQH